MNERIGNTVLQESGLDHEIPYFKTEPFIVAANECTHYKPLLRSDNDLFISGIKASVL
jgi:hypothetical protein